MNSTTAKLRAGMVNHPIFQMPLFQKQKHATIVEQTWEADEVANDVSVTH